MPALCGGGPVSSVNVGVENCISDCLAEDKGKSVPVLVTAIVLFANAATRLRSQSFADELKQVGNAAGLMHRRRQWRGNMFSDNYPIGALTCQAQSSIDSSAFHFSRGSVDLQCWPTTIEAPAMWRAQSEDAAFGRRA
ncbi:hypothetical protein AYJ54_13410 [Bradyrhizobium centrolobii]|uniref:Uncharacterized protein n=1 Tax=Bradyrhizobium centrolobii TaxID=1505087 RepID=A0A176YPQ8_9BRAD|nr:hypothetical protein AYJ54_13410 [Bradyrhizobium centrolobii]